MPLTDGWTVRVDDALPVAEAVAELLEVPLAVALAVDDATPLAVAVALAVPLLLAVADADGVAVCDGNTLMAPLPLPLPLPPLPVALDDSS